MGVVVRSWRRVLPAVATGAALSLAGCEAAGWPVDPVSRPSEVSARVWFCTPARVQGHPGEDKASDSAVTMEILAGPSSRTGGGARFAPDTVLGRAMNPPGERWVAGSVHELHIAWLEPGVDRSDLDGEALRVRVTRQLGQTGPFRTLDAWAFSFFISFDVVTATDAGDPSIGWHLDAMTSDYVVAPPDRQVLVDAPFADLRGWPHPCPQS
jgi:hypothetical protein